MFTTFPGLKVVVVSTNVSECMLYRPTKRLHLDLVRSPEILVGRVSAASLLNFFRVEHFHQAFFLNLFQIQSWTREGFQRPNASGGGGVFETAGSIRSLENLRTVVCNNTDGIRSLPLIKSRNGKHAHSEGLGISLCRTCRREKAYN